MLVKRKMSWEFFSDVNYFVFEGYYDVLTDWTGIDLCYVDEENLNRLVQHWENTSDWITGKQTINGRWYLTTKSTPSLLPEEQVVTTNGPLSLYALKASVLFINPFFDYENYADKRMFMAVHIYDAVLQGLRDGISAGLKGGDIIDGLTPAEYAWMYTAYLKDPVGQCIAIAPLYDHRKFPDEMVFTFAHIHAAVIHGLEEGIAAGMKGAETIGKLSPAEYAERYMSHLKDPLEQIGSHDFKLQTTA